VAISAIAKDLGTTVAGVQTAITLFTLTMAAQGSLACQPAQLSGRGAGCESIPVGRQLARGKVLMLLQAGSPVALWL
jgi:hypothetical protein